MSNIFGSDQNTAVPGGSVGKPLMIALLALLASRYFGGKGDAKPAEPAPAPKVPDAEIAAAEPGSILDGLDRLIKQFQKEGFGDKIDTWINPGTNKDVSSDEVKVALGNDVVDELSNRTGLSRNQVIDELARMLPNMVDRLTPDGRIPTRHEIERLIG